MTTDYEQACTEYDKGNYSVAYEKFYDLAVAHDVSCQMNVANMLLHGVGTAENAEKAYEWYKQAAFNDDSQAQYIYGWYCVEKGDEVEGLKYLELSAEADFADAVYDLAGWCYYAMYTCEKDIDRAISLYEKATLLGKKEAFKDFFLAKAKKDGKFRTVIYLIKNLSRLTKKTQ